MPADGDSRQFWVVGMGADALRGIVRDYVMSIADDDAVLVIDETGFLTGQSVMRSSAAIHWFGREYDQLRDRSLRYLRFASWSCVHRSRAVSSEGMERRSRSSGGRICACRCRLCDQNEACNEKAIARGDSRLCAIEWDAGDTSTEVGDIAATMSGRERLRAWGQQRLMCFDPGRSPVNGRRHRPDAALIDWKRLSAGAGTNGPGCTIGVDSNRPSRGRSNSTVQMMVCGRAVY